MTFKVVVFMLLALTIVSDWAWRDYQRALHQPAVVGHPVIIEINKGDSFDQITDKLSTQQVNFRPLWFKVIAIQDKAVNKLKTGEYELASGLTLPEILAQIAQ